MKITMRFAGSINYIGSGNGNLNFSANVYLNGKLVGWTSWFDSFELENVPEGENTIAIEGAGDVSGNAGSVGKRKVRFTAKEDVTIWARSRGKALEILITGEDVKILEDKSILREGFFGQRMEDEEPEGKEGEKKKTKESAWESFKNKYI
ncbi:MAG: hypothetical protein KHZ62_00710 [Clostridiales bacterium]|nr:hypothetical protein [Clostridiales bacterium]